MVQLSVRRALLVAFIALLAGALAGTAVAHDAGRPHRWKGEKAKAKEKDKDDDDTTTSPTTSTPTVPTTTSTTTSTATAPTTPTTTTTTAPAPAPAPVPELGRSVALATGSGTVLVRAPGGDATPLTGAAASLPTGTRVDTRRGEVVLTSAVDTAGATQTGRFSGGVFEVRQQGTYTQLVLVGGHWRGCRPARRARAATATAAATRRKPIRRLWGSDDNGRFQTRGGGSVATVRGTRWLTEDFCDGTRTTVTEGAVAVRSRRTGRTVVVRAGHSRFVAR